MNQSMCAPMFNDLTINPSVVNGSIKWRGSTHCSLFSKEGKKIRESFLDIKAPLVVCVVFPSLLTTTSLLSPTRLRC